jgi:hypothetical protein
MAWLHTYQTLSFYPCCWVLLHWNSRVLMRRGRLKLTLCSAQCLPVLGRWSRYEQVMSATTACRPRYVWSLLQQFSTYFNAMLSTTLKASWLASGQAKPLIRTSLQVNPTTSTCLTCLLMDVPSRAQYNSTPSLPILGDHTERQARSFIHWLLYLVWK